MILQIEIDNDIFQKILIRANTNLSYIELENISNTQKISIDNESIHSLISSLKIIYREKFNIEYPNKYESGIIKT